MGKNRPRMAQQRWYIGMTTPSRRGILAARTLLSSYNLKAPVDVEFLSANILGIPIVRHDFPDELCGTLVYSDGCPIIGVNGNHALVRQRFTISHEIIHHVRQHGPAMCLNGSGGWQEYEANSGAAELLMPAAYIKLHAVYYDFDVVRLARRYNVSCQAMEYRLINLGLIKETEEAAGG
jgi:Zn-dependent peptidase ImmA (M78 family)